MKECTCGKPVRMRAMHVKVNRKKGVQNWIEHADGSDVCVPGEWDVVMMVPYPANKAEWPSTEMLTRWESTSPITVGETVFIPADPQVNTENVTSFGGQETIPVPLVVTDENEAIGSKD